MIPLSQQEVEVLINRWRISCGLMYSALFVCLGLIVGSLGPALKVLEVQLDKSQSQVGWVFSARGTGYLAAGLLCGRLLDRLQKFKYFSSHLLLAATAIILGGLTALIQYVPNLWVMIPFYMMNGWFMGIIDVVGNTLIVWVWQGRVGPWMQLLHFGFGLGAVLSGLIFGVLQTIFDNEQKGVYLGYILMALSTIPMGLMFCCFPSPVDKSNSNDSKDHLDAEENASSIEMDTISPSFEEVSLNSPQRENTGANTPTEAKLSFVMFSGLFLFCYVGAEIGFGGWIYSYSLDIGWVDKPSNADYLTSTFWGALCIGRFFAIPISARFTARIMILVDMTGCIISMSSLAVVQFLVFGLDMSPLIGEISIWICTFGLGFSMGSVYASMINLPTELNIRVTGKNTGWLVVFASGGELVMPLLFSFLFAIFSPKILPIGIICICISALITYIAVMKSGSVPLRDWVKVWINKKPVHSQIVKEESDDLDNVMPLAESSVYEE